MQTDLSTTALALAILLAGCTAEPEMTEAEKAYLRQVQEHEKERARLRAFADDLNQYLESQETQ